jgi:hypothetical protein
MACDMSGRNPAMYALWLGKDTGSPAMRCVNAAEDGLRLAEDQRIPGRSVQNHLQAPFPGGKMRTSSIFEE